MSKWEETGRATVVDNKWREPEFEFTCFVCGNQQRFGLGPLREGRVLVCRQCKQAYRAQVIVEREPATL